MKEVYADVLFLVNFSMDYLCFFLTTKVLHRKTRPIRMLLASVFGALYGVAAVFLPIHQPAAFLADLTVCAIMCAVVYAGKRTALREYLVSTGVYFGISALVGGVMTAFCSLLNRLGLPIDVIGGDQISTWVFALIAAAAAVTAGMAGRFFRGSAGKQTGEVGIFCRGQQVSLRAVTDTGNLLRDPISGRPVIVTSVKAVARILPPGLPAAVRRGDFTSDEFRRMCTDLRIRLIPTQTASGAGMLLGILPDRMTITDQNGTRETDALFAPADIRFEGYEALLPPGLDT